MQIMNGLGIGRAEHTQRAQSRTEATRSSRAVAVVLENPAFDHIIWRRFAADDWAMVAPRTGMPETSMTCRSAAISQERSAFRSARITPLYQDPRHRAVVLSDRAQR